MGLQREFYDCTGAASTRIDSSGIVGGQAFHRAAMAFKYGCRNNTNNPAVYFSPLLQAQTIY